MNTQGVNRATVEHITLTVTGTGVDADCSACGQGISTESEPLLAAWIKQHMHAGHKS